MTLTRRGAIAAGAAFSAAGFATTSAKAKEWDSVGDLDLTSFQTKFDQMAAAGFHPTVVDGYSVNGKTKFAGIWVKSPTPEWVVRSELDVNSYQVAFDHYVKAGFRPRRTSVYGDGKKYVGMWDKGGPGGWLSRHGLKQDAFQAEFNTHAGEGMRLVNIGVCGSFMSGVTYAGVWEPAKGIPSEVRTNLDPIAFQAKIDQMTNDGFRPRQICGYNVLTMVRYCAIWEKRGGPMWEAHHHLTAGQFQQKHNELSGNGFRLVDVSGFDIGGQSGFAGIWEKG